MIEKHRSLIELHDTETGATFWPCRSPRGFRQYLNPLEEADKNRLRGVYEPGGLRFVREWAKNHRGSNGLAFLDVGCWRADYTLEALTGGIPGSKIVAIEPNPASRVIVAETLAVNGFAIRALHGRPLWSEGDKRLAFENVMKLREARPGEKPVSEPTRTLNFYADLLDADCPCILKMDIEGAEIHALAGGPAFLKALPAGSWIMLEIHHPAVSAVEVAGILEGHGFARWHINPAEGRPVRPITEPIKEQTQLTFWTR